MRFCTRRQQSRILFLFRNDVILYSVDEDCACVYIRAVCTKGMDLSAHLEQFKED